MLSRRFYVLQFVFGVVSAVIIGFKIWIECQDTYAEGRDDKLIAIDMIFFAFVTICTFGIIAAYTILYMKFISLINSSNGFLDFMRFQTHTFFIFVFVILTLKTISTISSPIEFDILEDMGAGDK